MVTKNSESDNILYRQGEDTPHVSTSSESKTKAAQKATENLNLGGRVVVHESAEGLEGKEATAKGWYDTQTGQIHVVLSNNADAADVTQTILHEAVAHHGLRELFGHNVMDAFLDSVLAAASQEVKTLSTNCVAGTDGISVPPQKNILQGLQSAQTLSV